MEIVVLAGVALAMALTAAIVLLKLFFALLAAPFKLTFAVAGGVVKVMVVLLVVGLAALVALPLLLFAAAASTVAIALVALL
jgi:hypothetical protein